MVVLLLTSRRPLPLTTVELQKLASRKLRLESSALMGIAENLYTQGYISYPRTETDQYPQDTDFVALLGFQQNHPEWGEEAQRQVTFNN